MENKNGLSFYFSVVGFRPSIHSCLCAILSSEVSARLFDKIYSINNMILLLLLLSRFSCVRLCTTPQMAAHQAPSSLGFSRQEHWSGLPLLSPVHESERWKWSLSVVSILQDPMDCSLPGSSVHGIFQARALVAIDSLFLSKPVSAFMDNSDTSFLVNFRHLSPWSLVQIHQTPPLTHSALKLLGLPLHITPRQPSTWILWSQVPDPRLRSWTKLFPFLTTIPF